MSRGSDLPVLVEDIDPVLELEVLKLTAHICEREGIWRRDCVDMIYAAVLKLVMEAGD